MEPSSTPRRQFAGRDGDTDRAGNNPGDGMWLDDRRYFLEVINRRIEHRLPCHAAKYVGNFVDVLDEEEAEHHAHAGADDSQAQSISHEDSSHTAATCTKRFQYANVA